MSEAPAPIRSTANPRFRMLAELVGKSRERRRLGASVIEGAHLLEAYVARFGAPRRVFVPEDAPAPVARLAAGAGAEVLALDRRLFARVSQVENGHGPLAIVDIPRAALPESIVEDLVYLDRIQDPGNVGSILRTCAAVGLRRVATAPGTASCWAPKVLRAGQGAHFHLEIHEDVEWEAIGRRSRVALRYATAEAPQRIDECDLSPPSIWAFGNEGQGVAEEIRRSAPDAAVAIAQTAGVESLNVGVAAAICLYEQWRQRGFPGARPPGPPA
jgi:TrmH family RNA methyltransferase